MNRKILTAGVGALALGAAVLAFSAGPAAAAYTAQVQDGTLDIVGDNASDKLALLLAPGAPGTLQLDVGEDGTADFSFDRSTFTAIDVQAGGGDDEVVVDQRSTARSPTTPSRSTAAAATTRSAAATAPTF